MVLDLFILIIDSNVIVIYNSDNDKYEFINFKIF